jgi:hypothetical protein
MNEFGRTPLLILAASIGSSDDWVMAASSGAVTLTPLRMMSDGEYRSSSDSSALLRLTDLGYLTDTGEGTAAPSTSPLSNAVVVLLLAWPLQATVARLDALARTSIDRVPDCYAPEDWLDVSHHFVNDGEWDPMTPGDEIARRAGTLRGLPAASRRHFIFGSLAGEMVTRSLESARAGPPVDESSRGWDASAHGAREVDPLMFTNPGSVPEGLSPLFVRHRGPTF